jgi:hypothetical protein
LSKFKTFNCKDCGLLSRGGNKSDRCLNCAKIHYNKKLIDNFNSRLNLEESYIKHRLRSQGYDKITPELIEQKRTELKKYRQKTTNCKDCGVTLIRNHHKIGDRCVSCKKKNKKEKIKIWRKNKTEHLKEYTLKYSKNNRDKFNKYARANSENLTDRYIKNQLKMAGFAQTTPEIIEQKRMSLKIKRTIKQINTELKQAL